MLTRTKRIARIIIRMITDCKERVAFCKRGDAPALPYKLSLTQPILPSASLAEKKFNLDYVAQHIGEYVINPGEVLSFWKIVGNTRHLKSSRCIRNNRVSMERGGGLCQAASIIYHLSLLGGLKVVERHNHSIDLYGDGPRFCPIGLDATVSYGYKDLRIYNQTDGTLRFDLSVVGDELRLVLESSTELKERAITLTKSISDNLIEVKTIYADSGELLATSIYKVLTIE